MSSLADISTYCREFARTQIRAVGTRDWTQANFVRKEEKNIRRLPELGALKLLNKSFAKEGAIIPISILC
jgi:hypothetical protein